MREVTLDTETTGLDPANGDRIVEIGCVELVNHVPSGRTFHRHVNPERDMPDAAFAVHGLSAEFLSDKELFGEIVDDLLVFIEDSRLIIHNAEFDLGFINAELKRLNREPLLPDRAIDTVKIARRKFPGAQASLDALCRRFNIDISDRQIHGALKDARLLAEVYLELVGGRQPGLGLAAATMESGLDDTAPGGPRRPPRAHAPTAEEEAAHAAFMDGLTDPVWRAP
ncbi:MAG: DNA polymerase III subunit epsilon [Rhodospirillales bacterium]|nr:DNA polymerase III subunit epsilon [Rhodospirillales bacterium]